MKSRTLCIGIACVCLVLLLCACGQGSAGSRVTTAKAGPTPTAVPSPLVSFASYSDPILRTSVGEGTDLLHKMKHEKAATLGNLCTLAGGDLSNSQTALHIGYAPPSATTAYQTAVKGFKFVLSATDECGMAADTSSTSEMKTASKDLEYGVWLLSQAESAIARWQQTS